MPTLIQKKFNTAGVSDANNFNNFTDLKNYLAPLDLPTLDVEIQILIKGTLAWPTATTLSVSKADDTHRVRLMPDPTENVNLLERSVLAPGSSGAAITWTRANSYSGGLSSGIDIYDMRILISGGAGNTTPIFGLGSRNVNMVSDNVFARNRVYDTSTAASPTVDTALFRTGTSGSRVLFESNLFVIDSAAGKCVIADGANGQVRKNTFVAINAAKNASIAIRDGYGGYCFDNIFEGFSELLGTSTTAANKGNNYTNIAPTSGTTTGFTVVSGVNALVMNEATDFRPQAGSAAIGGATSSAVSTPDILSNNRGLAPDAGAWQLTPASPLPKATITQKSVSGTTVTLSGTFENAPTSATASMALAQTPFNSGVAQSPTPVTLGDGTFTVTFTNVRVGRYVPSLLFSKTNSGVAAATSTVGNIDVIGATGTVTSQVINGQELTVSGTTSGNPISGVLYVPASAVTPNLAYASGPTDLDLGSGTFTVKVPLTPGSYDQPAILLTTASGTSLPLGGAISAIKVIGISGNPEAAEATQGAAAPVSIPLDVYSGLVETDILFGRN